MANIVVCIDPAYNEGINQGINPIYYEGSVMYDIALLLKEELERIYGFKAILSKCGEHSDPTITDRISNATIMEANCFISLHSFMHHDYNKPGLEDTIKLGNTVSVWQTKQSSSELRWSILNSIRASIAEYEDLEEITMIDIDEELYIRSGVPFSYYVPIIELLSKLHDTTMDSYIVSLGYHTCHLFCDWILDKENQKMLVSNIAKAIADHYTE